MKVSAKPTLLLLGFIAFLSSQVRVIDIPIIGRMLGFSAKVSAQTSQVYIPPVGPSKPSRTKGSGSRGCDAKVGQASDHRLSGATNLQLIVPKDHVPLTVSARPTFFWYVSDTSLPVRFTLVEPGIAKPIEDRTFNVTRPGIVQLTLPSDVAGLALGKEYRWTVSLVCNKERPSENTYAYSSIKRVGISLELKSKLARARQNPEERSLVYARSGIWYDALLSSYIGYKANPQGKVANWYFSKLLTQIGMPAVSDRQLQQPNIVSSH